MVWSAKGNRGKHGRTETWQQVVRMMAETGNLELTFIHLQAQNEQNKLEAA